MPSYSLPYRNAFGNGVRPYLSLHVTGINGRSGPIVGLIDSSADRTLLAMGFATLMGYGAAELEPDTVLPTAAKCRFGTRSRRRAFVVGLPQPEFALQPTFVPGNVPSLWGRADFFQVFGIAFDERSGASP